MVSNTSGSVMSWIGSQSIQRRPALELRAETETGTRLARTRLSSARRPMHETMRPPKRGLALRYRRSSRSIGPRFLSDVQFRIAGVGQKPRRRTIARRSSFARARIRGTSPIVARICASVPGHSTRPRGAWTTTSWSGGTRARSRIIMAWLSLPPLWLTARRAPALIISATSAGMASAVTARSPRGKAPAPRQRAGCSGSSHRGGACRSRRSCRRSGRDA